MVLRESPERSRISASAEVPVGDLDEAGDGEAVGAGALGGLEVGGGEVSGQGGEGLVEGAGLGALAVGGVVAEVAEDGGDRDASGGGLAEVAAAVAVEVGGLLRRCSSRSRASLGVRGSLLAATFSRRSLKLVISETTTCIRSSSQTDLIAATSFLTPCSRSLERFRSMAKRSCWLSIALMTASAPPWVFIATRPTLAAEAESMARWSFSWSTARKLYWIIT